MPAGNFEILHALKCVLGTGAPFAYSTYLQVAIFVQRFQKSVTYMYGASLQL